MAIKSEWIVADTTARNALAVTDGDVMIGAECRLLVDGSIYRAVRSGSGASCWNAVDPSGSFTPTVTAGTNVTDASGNAGFYIEQGDIVSGVASCAITPTSAAAIDFAIDPPVGTVDIAGGLVSVAGSVDGGIILGGSGKLQVYSTATSTAAASYVMCQFWYRKA